MKVTDAFLGEHGVFYAQFKHLEQTIPAASQPDQVHIHAAMLASALATHAQLENDLLFSAMEPHVGPMGPLAVMRREHEEIEGTLAGLQEVQDTAEAQRMLLYAIRVARDHFAKEERILYPMAEKALDAETLSQLGAQWAEHRAVSV